ncbi:hypothetical protein DA091_05405 [Vibrio alginolyticus]|nr:hypothetical protein DA091_05405 [Vibrio alginolyticus]
MMQTRFCRTQFRIITVKVIFPRTLECARLLSFLKNENKQLVFVLKTNIENFTNNNKLLFCQLSKLLKSYVASQGSYIF